MLCTLPNFTWFPTLFCPAYCMLKVSTFIINSIIALLTSFLFFYCSIIDLQCCVSFRCTAKWFWDVYIYVCVCVYLYAAAAAAAKSLQSCPTLCDPIDSSPPGSPVPGILQARTLEWAVISFSVYLYTHMYFRLFSIIGYYKTLNTVPYAL